MKADRSGILFGGHGSALGPRFAKYSPGCIFRQMTLGRDPDSQNIISEGCNLHNGVSASDLDAVDQRPCTSDGLQYGNPVRLRDWSGSVSLTHRLFAEDRTVKNEASQKGQRGK
jgi:hypothetical protein